MTSYTKTMMESLAEVRELIVEDNMDLMRKAAGGAMQTIKMKDGKLKMDSFTASAMMQVYDNVNPANKKKIETIINSGKKNQMMKLQSMAMKAIKSGYGEETDLDEAYELGTDEYREYLEKLTPGQIQEEISELDNLIKELDEGILGNIAKAAGKSVAKGVKVGAKKVGGAIKRKAGGGKIGKAIGKVKSGIKKTKAIGGKIKKAAKTGKAYGDEYDPMLERLEIIEIKLNDYYRILEELDLEGVELDEASARADAMRAMGRGRKVDPADVDVDATDDDIKGASKNIIMQMRKAVSMKGSFPVEFADKKKVKIPAKVAQAVQDKYNSFRKPADKEKFQAQVAKSYKDMLRVLKAGYMMKASYEEVERVTEHLARIKGNSPADQGRRAATEDDIEDAEKKGDKKLVAKLKEDELDEMSPKDKILKKTADYLQALIKGSNLPDDNAAFSAARDYVEAGNLKTVASIVKRIDTDPRDAIINAVAKGMGKREAEKIFNVRIMRVEEVEEVEELDEAKYELYHKDFSSAMQHAYKMAKKLHGITVKPSEIDDKVASGPRKPSEGKTNTYRLKGDKGGIQVQVYNKGGNKPYELNFYKEEVELDEALPSHLKKFFDKDGNPKSKEGKAAWERLAKMKGFKKYTSKQVKMAIGIAFDKRYVQGNMTGAVNAIEKIAKGLSEIEPVANALKRANENTILGRIDAKLKERKNG